jgi:hypothetical protein
VRFLFCPDASISNYRREAQTDGRANANFNTNLLQKSVLFKKNFVTRNAVFDAKETLSYQGTLVASIE